MKRSIPLLFGGDEAHIRWSEIADSVREQHRIETRRARLRRQAKRQGRRGPPRETR